MSIVNLTPHELNIHDADGGVITVTPSGTVARVSTTTVPAGDVEGIPTYSVEYGEVKGLPEPGDDTLVVSGLVAAACPRDDVFSPGELIRDEQGRPVGCQGLKRSRHPVVYAIIDHVPDDSSWGYHEEIGALFTSREAAQSAVNEKCKAIAAAQAKEKRVEARFLELLDAERLQRYGLQTERHRELKEMAKADVGITAEEYSLAYCASPVRVERLDVR